MVPIEPAIGIIGIAIVANGHLACRLPTIGIIVPSCPDVLGCDK